jgi:parallel beta-helix repeat protein
MEDVVIGIPLNLIGAGAGTSVIDAAGKPNGVFVNGYDHPGLTHVTVAGFTIKDAQFEGVLVVSANDVTIRDNTIEDNDQSPAVFDPTANHGCAGQPAFETDETGDCGGGLHLIGVWNSTVSGNKITRNDDGILISDETAESHDILVYQTRDEFIRQLRYCNVGPRCHRESGRAVIYPIYKSTFERGDGLTTDVPDKSARWRDPVIMWAKDLSRALSYAATRPDLEREKLAYLGMSWGGLIPAVEPRIKVNILVVGGLNFQESLPEVDPVNFLPHVTQPTLMLNDKYDFFYPERSCQEPFYRSLETKRELKKRIVYDSGHLIPRNEIIKETLNWLDQYLGEVQ